MFTGPVFRETPSSLFQPDPVSGLQFLATFTKISLEPERLLMLAVLEDAIKCLEKYASLKSGGNRKLFDEAIDWIRAEDADWLFSFNNVCDALGLNARRLRVALLDKAAGRCRILNLEQTHRIPPYRTSCRAYAVTRKPKIPDRLNRSLLYGTAAESAPLDSHQAARRGTSVQRRRIAVLPRGAYRQKLSFSLTRCTKPV
jgi:hypothetical protein